MSSLYQTLPDYKNKYYGSHEGRPYYQRLPHFGLDSMGWCSLPGYFVKYMPTYRIVLGVPCTFIPEAHSKDEG